DVAHLHGRAGPISLGPHHGQGVLAQMAALAGEVEDPGLRVGGGGDARGGHGANPIESWPSGRQRGAGAEGRARRSWREEAGGVPTPGLQTATDRPRSADGPSVSCGAVRRAGVAQAAAGAVNSASMRILTSSE